jgi:hypothetical protein
MLIHDREKEKKGSKSFFFFVLLTFLSFSHILQFRCSLFKNDKSVSSRSITVGLAPCSNPLHRRRFPMQFRHSHFKYKKTLVNLERFLNLLIWGFVEFFNYRRISSSRMHVRITTTNSTFRSLYIKIQYSRQYQLKNSLVIVGNLSPRIETEKRWKLLRIEKVRRHRRVCFFKFSHVPPWRASAVTMVTSVWGFI